MSQVFSSTGARPWHYRCTTPSSSRPSAPFVNLMSILLPTRHTPPKTKYSPNTHARLCARGTDRAGRIKWIGRHNSAQLLGARAFSLQRGARDARAPPPRYDSTSFSRESRKERSRAVYEPSRGAARRGEDTILRVNCGPREKWLSCAGEFISCPGLFARVTTLSGVDRMNFV